MFEKMTKFHLFFLLCVSQRFATAMELPLVVPLETLSVIAKSPDKELYQIKSQVQVGPTCGYFSASNGMKIMSYLISPKGSSLGVDAWEVSSNPSHGFDWEKDFLSYGHCPASDFILEKSMVFLVNQQEPASIRDIMQVYMKTKLREIRSQKNEDFADKDVDIMVQILEETLKIVKPTTGFVQVPKEGRRLMWKVEKEEFITAFRDRTIAEHPRAVKANNSLEYLDRLAIVAQKVAGNWLDQVFDENFKTSFSFAPYSRKDPIGNRIYERVNSGGWLGDAELLLLIRFCKLEEKGLPSISVLGGRRTFEAHVGSMKRYLDQGIPTGTLQSIIESYKESIGYKNLFVLKQKLITSQDDLVEGFIVRLGAQKIGDASGANSAGMLSNLLDFFIGGVDSSEQFSGATESDDQRDSAHWVCFVVARFQGVVRYYVSDSYHNQSLLKNAQINDIIEFLEDQPLRKESLYYIDPLYYNAASSRADYSLEDFIADYEAKRPTSLVSKDSAVPQVVADSAKAGHVEPKQEFPTKNTESSSPDTSQDPNLKKETVVGKQSSAVGSRLSAALANKKVLIAVSGLALSGLIAYHHMTAKNKKAQEQSNLVDPTKVPLSEKGEKQDAENSTSDPTDFTEKMQGAEHAVIA